MQAILILAAIIPAAVLLILIYRADRLEKEPFSLLIALVLFGILATLVAPVAEQLGDILMCSIVGPGTMLYDLLLYFGIVAVSEEAVKYLLLRWRTWSSPHFNCSFDGVVYAVFVSLGFALWENIGYVLQYGFGTAIARAITAVPGHACFGVFMGTWYGMAKRWSLAGQEDKSYRDRWLAFLIPTLIHGAYDYIAISHMDDLWWLFLLFIAGLFVVSIVLVKKLSKNDNYMMRPSVMPPYGASPYGSAPYGTSPYGSAPDSYTPYSSPGRPAIPLQPEENESWYYDKDSWNG